MTTAPKNYRRTNKLALALRKNLGQGRIKGTYEVSSSLLHGMCVRQEALAHVYKRERKEFHPPDLMLMFGIGQAVHDAAQNYLLGPKGLIFGAWRCMYCGELHGDYVKPANRIAMPEGCKTCRRPRYVDRDLLFRYVEDELIDPPTGLMCHPDGYDLDGDLFEFKSQGTLSFQGKPKPEHMTQVQTNLLLQRRVRGNAVPRSRLVYIDKSANSLETALTEFEVMYDEAMAVEAFDPVIQLQKFRVQGVLPERVCDSPDDRKAKGCPMVKECFG